MRRAVAVLSLLTSCSIACPAAAEEADTYIDLGALSLTLAVLGGAIAVPVCAFSLEAEGRVACEWTAGGAAIALTATAVPLLVIGVIKHTPIVSESVPLRVAVTPRGSTLTMTWTF